MSQTRLLSSQKTFARTFLRLSNRAVSCIFFAYSFLPFSLLCLLFFPFPSLFRIYPFAVLALPFLARSSAEKNVNQWAFIDL